MTNDIHAAFEARYKASAQDPACAEDLRHFTDGWNAARADNGSGRDAFEAWWTNGQDGNPESISRRGDGYFWADADRAWEVWQAATQARDAEIAALREDAERYRLLRRGQRWSVIDGIGDTLRAEELDAAVDQARKDGAR